MGPFTTVTVRQYQLMQDVIRAAEEQPKPTRELTEALEALEAIET